MDEHHETVYDIEKMADAAAAARDNTKTEITFDNSGNMVVKNRAYQRNGKRLWRAVMEGHKSARHFTQPSGMEHPKTNRASKKRERQNRKAGRRK